MTDDERLNYIRAIIRHRVPEATEDEIVEAFAPPPDPDSIPGHIALQIMTVLDRMSERIDGYEAKFAAAEPTPARLH